MRVEVHFFKPSGKWYTAEEVSWPYHGDLENPYSFKDVVEMHTRAVSSFLTAASLKRRFAGMVAVCTGTNPLGFPQTCVVPE